MNDDVVQQDGIGERDGLERLWTPYRIAYIRGENKPADASAAECPFCRIPGLDDEEGLVVRRGETAYVVLNLYPYAPGHLMVCPYRHVADYTEVTDDEAAEIADLTRGAMRTIRAASDRYSCATGRYMNGCGCSPTLTYRESRTRPTTSIGSAAAPLSS